MTGFSDEQLREAFAASGEVGEEPIDAAALWDVLQGEADADVRDATLDRLARDAELREDWQVARAFADQAEAADEDIEARPPTGSNGGAYRFWLTISAVAAAVAIAVLLWPRSALDPYDSPGPEVRTGADEAFQSTVEGALPRAAAELSWREVEGARTYDVVVTAESLDPVFEALGLTTPHVTIPEDRLETIGSGERVLFRIEAVMRDGSRRRSEAFTAVLQ